MKFKIVLEPSKDGGYAVHVPVLRGCHTQGENLEEALENAKDAIRTYIIASEEVARKRNSELHEIEVAV
jgi:predicted RNase H-like HicB family nuclease